MSEFLELLPPPQALQKFLEELRPRPTVETVATAAALGRVTAAAVKADYPLPSFPRSTVDGYAVRAKDTHGASETLPAYLNLRGEVPMGGAPNKAVQTGECMIIHTGGMLPEGADAVVMIEHTQEASAAEIEVWRAVGHGENVLKVGEDVQAGQEVIPAGTILRPAEIGGLMALGIAEVEVVRKPLVGILSSGDEVIAPGRPLQPGQVYDVNSYTLAGLIEQGGGRPRPYGIIPDKAEAFRAAAQRAHAECDVVIFTAGSSVSVRDLTAQTIDELGAPGVLVHGVSIKPGKPTILAICAGKAVIGLPGNPVSALVVASIFVTATIEALLGLQTKRPRGCVSAKLTVNLSSQAGREDWIGVKLTSTAHGYTAEPIFGKSNLIFTLARADGLLRIPPTANGIAAGEIVEVVLL